MIERAADRAGEKERERRQSSQEKVTKKSDTNYEAPAAGAESFAAGENVSANTGATCELSAWIHV